MFLQEVHTVIEGEHLSLLLKMGKKCDNKIKEFLLPHFFFHEFYAFMLFGMYNWTLCVGYYALWYCIHQTIGRVCL